MAHEGGLPPEIAISRTSTESRESSKKVPKVQKEGRPKVVPAGGKPDAESEWYRKRQYDAWKTHNAPDVKWHIKWDQNCFPNGRVLIIDYVSTEAIRRNGPSGKRHITVAAQEFDHLKGLRSFYDDPKRVGNAALRVVHVSNAAWATSFLLKKYNVDNPSDLVGMPNFAKWARYEKPRQRKGKPFPTSRSFSFQRDPWRNIARTAFGVDYLKSYPSPPPRRRLMTVPPAARGAHMMHLNDYEDSRNPHGTDVSVQRLSVYVQRKLGQHEERSPEDDMKNPYNKTAWSKLTGDPVVDEKLCIGDFDNGNTIIIFENSASMLLNDCLVQPRNEFERRWRRLSFFLRKEDVLSDARLAAQCINFILTDVFHGLGVVWNEFLGYSSDHVAILEDKIYENPADESRAPELWTNQANWLKVDKIMYMHQDLVREVQSHLRQLAAADEDDATDPQNLAVAEWLADTTTEYERLGHTVQEDLVQPTNNLSDLMYKSVGIRDSRQSLQLSLSMWRLSWITFIFLPLTFVGGLFGMNVDLFAENPSIAWYFGAAAVLMILVLVLWYCVKHSLQRKRQTPYQRGLYEYLFHELEDEYPSLWSVSGALDDVVPNGFVSRMKWRLLKYWFSPEKTIDKKLYSSLAGDDADLGSFAQLKHYLLKRWLPQIIENGARVGDDIALAELGSSRRPSLQSIHHVQGTIEELARMSTPIAMSEAEPSAVQQFANMGLRPIFPRSSRESRSSPRHSEDRPSSRGSSGMMIEERNFSDSESDAGETSSKEKSQEE